WVEDCKSIQARETGGGPSAVAHFVGFGCFYRCYPGLAPWALCCRPPSRALFRKTYTDLNIELTNRKRLHQFNATAVRVKQVQLPTPVAPHLRRPDLCRISHPFT